MKTKLFITILFAMIVLVGQAQSDYSAYLNRALEKLDAGDCESAQKNYNVYKELSGDAKPSVEVLIQDCADEKNKTKTYSVGETMQVGDAKYKVAYVRDGGKHGLAVFDNGWASIYSVGTSKCVTQKGIPTLEEVKLIYANRDLVGLYDVYWTCTNANNGDAHYTVKDFSTGEESKRRYDEKKAAVILLIHRF